MNKNIFILFLCAIFAFSCGGIAVLDYSYTDDNSGGSGGDASGGAGGTASTSSSFNLTSSASNPQLQLLQKQLQKQMFAILDLKIAKKELVSVRQVMLVAMQK